MPFMPLSGIPTNLPAAPSGGEAAPTFHALISLGIYAGVATGLIVLILFMAWALGEKTHSETKHQPYESGILPTGTAHLREPVPFYLVAIFFIVFDVEAIFIVSWAVAYDLLGWAGFFQISFFIVILFLGLVYLWRKGGLDWGPRGRPAPVERRRNG
jgi:NADH-quinone oxidoreductase subunit A